MAICDPSVIACDGHSDVTVTAQCVTPVICLFLKAGSVTALQDKTRKNRTRKNTLIPPRAEPLGQAANADC